MIGTLASTIPLAGTGWSGLSAGRADSSVRVVFVHGLGAHPAQWWAGDGAIVGPLIGDDIQVVALSLPHHSADREDEVGTTLGALGGWLRSVVDELDEMADVFLVGHSLGAAIVGAAVADACPGWAAKRRVRGVGLLSYPCSVSVHRSLWAGAMLAGLPYADWVTSKFRGPLVRAMMSEVVNTAQLRRKVAALSTFALNTKVASRQTEILRDNLPFIINSEATLRPLAFALSRDDLRVSILHGRRDQWFHCDAVAAALATHLPGLLLTVAEEAGHDVLDDAPRESLDLIQRLVFHRGSPLLTR
jgi:alpha-beta hydrolase superfamily lysophospholipase